VQSGCPYMGPYEVLNLIVSQQGGDNDMCMPATSPGEEVLAQ